MATKGTQKQLVKKLEQLANLKLKGRTDADCAQLLGVSVRTIERWKASETYEPISRGIVADWKGLARHRLVDLAGFAIDQLRDIAQHSNSDMARFYASKELLEMAKLHEDKEESKDGVEELNVVVRLVQERRLTIVAEVLPLPGPGGQLPEGIQPKQDQEFLNKVLGRTIDGQAHVLP